MTKYDSKYFVRITTFFSFITDKYAVFIFSLINGKIFQEREKSRCIIIKKAIYILLVFLQILCVPFTAFGMDSSFVDVSDMWSWYEEQSAVHLPEEKVFSYFGEYSGAYSYFSDVENKCFYLRIYYKESSLTSKNKDVFVDFNIKNPSREYQFSVDANGFFNYDDNDKSGFKILTDFGNASEQGQIILIGIEFLKSGDKKLDNILSFRLAVNGNVYSLCDGIYLKYAEPVSDSKTETKPTSEKNTQSDKTKDTTRLGGNGEKTTSEKTTSRRNGAEDTTSKVSGAYEKSESEKSTEEKTTKFKYTGPAATAGEDKYTPEYTTGENRETEDHDFGDYTFESETEIEYFEGKQAETKQAEIITAQESAEGRFSPVSKALFISAGITAAAGFVIIVYFSKKANKK